MTPLPLSSLFPEWKGSVAPEAHERLHQAMVREELRLRDAKFLVAGVLSELDYDGLREKVIDVLPFGTLAEAEHGAKEMMQRSRSPFLRWTELDHPIHPVVLPHRYGVQSSDGGSNSVDIRAWVLPCAPGSSPLLQLLEAWLPFQDPLTSWFFWNAPAPK